jgi:DNA ligase-associated metallophosphoesterase
MDVAFTLAGHRLVADYSGALWWPALRLVVVADLHLEKASHYARHGQMLPPYDSLTTLDRLAGVVRRRDPATLVLLGDSFHDSAGAGRLEASARDRLERLAHGRSLIWLAGNHDESLPDHLPGERAGALDRDGLHLRHQPDGEQRPAEVIGHFHPVARVGTPQGAVRRRCFLHDGHRLILPAFGSLTGGLNVRDPAIAGLGGGRERIAYVLGHARVFAIREARLLPDRAR